MKSNIEKAMKEIKNKMETGINIHEELMNMIHFANDIKIIPENKKELEALITEMVNVLMTPYKMNINKRKTKIMNVQIIQNALKMIPIKTG